jgi:endonuclease III
MPTTKPVKKPAKKKAEPKPLAKQAIVRPKTAAARQTRVKKILDGLDAMYGDVTCALHHESPFQLLIATILSAQCTDKRVNQVTPGLFRKYPAIQDFASASQAEMASDIRSTGFFAQDFGGVWRRSSR